MAQKLAVYSLSDLKNTTDDALPLFLKHQRKFVQNHILTDVRLALGYIAVSVAALTFYLDYKNTWVDTKDWTLWAVIVYFLFNSTLTLWIWAVEKGKVFVGNRDDLLVSLASHVNKHDPIYRLKVRYSDPADPAGLQGQLLEIEASFTKWFTEEGHFIAEEFHRWLNSVLPILADDKKSK